jgi:hypothetical protein
MAAELRPAPRGPVRPVNLRHRREAARLRGGDGRGHAATLQRLASQRSEPPCLHGHARGGQTLQHEDARAAQGQLDGGQESDRPGAHDHDIDLFFHIIY